MGDGLFSFQNSRDRYKAIKQYRLLELIHPRARCYSQQNQQDPSILSFWGKQKNTQNHLSRYLCVWGCKDIVYLHGCLCTYRDLNIAGLVPQMLWGEHTWIIWAVGTGYKRFYHLTLLPPSFFFILVFSMVWHIRYNQFWAWSFEEPIQIDCDNFYILVLLQCGIEVAGLESESTKNATCIYVDFDI